MRLPWYTGGRLFLDIVFFAEPFDPAGGINQLLLSRKEGMAGGADLHLDILGGGSGFDYIPAGAAYPGHLVFGMNAFFHIS
jgi:hypothetical protein